MSNVKSIPGLLAVVVAVLAGLVFGAAQASATKAPIVISYEKTCDETTGHCVGTAGAKGTIEMQITSMEATRRGAKLTLTEWITVGDRSFTAEMKGRLFSKAGIILLSGRVTEGSFAGARIYQRSVLDPEGTVGTTTAWTGKLLLVKTRR